MDAAAREGGHVAMISTGWDPGLFSMNRVLGAALFPQAQQNTFWGRGLSQGHSDAVRRVPGVRRGVQYTIPSEEAIAEARAAQVADGRAAARLKAQGETGARTVLEVAPYLLSPTGLDELIRRDV